MFDKTSIRRAVLAVVFGMLSIFAGYQYAWHKDEFSSKSALQSLGWLAVVLVFLVVIGVMAFSRKSDSPNKILLAAVLGAIAADWGKEVLAGIDTKNLLILLGSLLGFIGFVLVISIKDFSFLGKLKPRPRVRAVETPTEAETTVVTAV